jgi:hypothetical protein
MAMDKNHMANQRGKHSSERKQQMKKKIAGSSILIYGYVILVLSCLIFGCVSRLNESTEIQDLGKTKIGENLYIKKMSFAGSNDRIYILVDEQDRVVAGTSMNYTISTGKTTQTINSTVR